MTDIARRVGELFRDLETVVALATIALPLIALLLGVITVASVVVWQNTTAIRAALADPVSRPIPGLPPAGPRPPYRPDGGRPHRRPQ